MRRVGLDRIVSRVGLLDRIGRILGLELLLLVAERFHLGIGRVGREVAENVVLDGLSLTLVQLVGIVLAACRKRQSASPDQKKRTLVHRLNPHVVRSIAHRIASRRKARKLVLKAWSPYLGPCRGNPATSVDCRVE